MSGHSQFKNIMYRKGAQDAKKARVFAKLARDITIAAKSGLPEPDKNPRLRLAIQAARAESMPKDNIERAIAKASQTAGGNDYVSARYEGFGPGKVAVIVEAMTDNKNRTAGNVRTISENAAALWARAARWLSILNESAISNIRPMRPMPTKCLKRRWKPEPMMWFPTKMHMRLKRFPRI